MYKPAPAEEELEALATVIRSSSEWDAESWRVPPELWTNTIALMYSGHESLGWEFVDSAWQAGFAGKRKQELIGHYLRSRLGAERLCTRDSGNGRIIGVDHASLPASPYEMIECSALGLDVDRA